MSMKLMVEVFHTEVGNPMHKLVLLKLADNANDNGECYPSYQHIAKQCEINKSTAMRAIEALCKKGLLLKQPRYLIGGKEQTSNFYVIVLPSLSGSGTKQPGVVAESNQGSGTKQPGVVAESNPNQSYITSKENIKDIPPYIPLGEKHVNQDGINEAALRCLAFYNDKAGCKCRDAKPFTELLTETKTRKAYTEDEITLVIEWALTQWRSRGGTPKPVNICRVTKFDGYLADAEKWRNLSATANAADVVEAFNSTFDGLLPPAELDRDLERKIYAFTDYLKDKSINGFIAYFETFKNNASDFYFGDGFTATLDFLLKPKTLRDTRAGAL
ncbi:helix-turn-helix domain-containing protein [Escherichia coli]|nr:helix-turn-helix domain-containing protein [Escherichia coli]MDZ9739523.1 helix-turn-helix domain-containing protein [Escherichia coli]MEA0397365.1 helix-turn-helix domain-containing protein [Escherichia coli]MEA0529136.1 helix-turn-helix domain-containing protein [Escherichia coli]